MKVKSKRDPYIVFIILGFIVFFASVVISEIKIKGWNTTMFIDIVILVIMLAFLVCCYFITYTVTPKFISYRIAFFYEEIPLNSIRSIEIGTTMWAGFKPAFARKGLIIRYNTYDEVYISRVNKRYF
ncbi:PH domain-containing protein [Flavobacterium agricola]|uniref:PH domain-containing protein n=1 Tax=Flavobacterium agricola TaxID=2870839 RepID=A0ABY6LXY9_9FLAO|nr:PH domain-containing protein [Flavobacterium agricola]UYW01203.1 PH domain-containing protein [Flavobacterium agricola]